MDETDSAARAMREAIALARLAGAELLLLHVGTSGEGERALAMALRLAKRQDVKATSALVRADGESVGEKVVHEAEQWGADLIVVGRHNRGLVERLLLGSVSEAIVRAADMPVLLVRRATLPLPSPR